MNAYWYQMRTLRTCQHVVPRHTTNGLDASKESSSPFLAVECGFAQPVTLAPPVSMWPVKRRDQAESVLTVTVKSYQPLSYATALK
jgi:hypothetical protein